MLFSIPDIEELDFNREISPQDWMARGKDAQWYYRRGYEALKVIVYECKRAHVAPKQILDFGCGHGNVARMLAAWYSKATVFGQDVPVDWLQWCEEVLGIKTIESATNIKDVKVENGAYDLIWVGSIFTHIPATSARRLLEELKGGLTEEGILIFTSAGAGVAEGFVPGEEKHLSFEGGKSALDGYRNNGHGFAPYQNGRYPDWGRALVTFDWMYKEIKSNRLALRSFLSKAWGKQDVFSVTNA